MIVTNEFIDRGRHDAGGWTKAQLEILGVQWPAPRQWKSHAIGKTISDDDARRFLLAKNQPDRVVEAVREDLVKRSEAGLRKYGVTLDKNGDSMRVRLQHLYEELLDGANYIKSLMMLIDGELGPNAKVIPPANGRAGATMARAAPRRS